MKYLFIFAHPDDETVSCSATMHQLLHHGDDVIIASVTDGAAGEAHERAENELKKHGSLAELRRTELRKVADVIGVKDVRFLDFSDGEITNKMVWDTLLKKITQLIDDVKPNVVITFDHSGWYFHLDHVGTSIATTLAFQQASHTADILFHAHMKVEGAEAKWKYIFPKKLPITHVVDAAPQRDMKLRAMGLHASQDLHSVEEKVRSEENHQELFQAVFTTKKGKALLRNHPIFKKFTVKK